LEDSLLRYTSTSGGQAVSVFNTGQLFLTSSGELIENLAIDTTNNLVPGSGTVGNVYYLPDSKSTHVTTYTVPQKVGSTINYPEITKS